MVEAQQPRAVLSGSSDFHQPAEGRKPFQQDGINVISRHSVQEIQRKVSAPPIPNPVQELVRIPHQWDGLGLHPAHQEKDPGLPCGDDGTLRQVFSTPLGQGEVFALG